jgi:hypothetical protein
MKQSGTNTFRVLVKRSRHIRQQRRRRALAAPPTQSVRDDPSFESAHRAHQSTKKNASIQVKSGGGDDGIENNKRVMLGFFLPLPGLCMWDIRHSSFLKRSARERAQASKESLSLSLWLVHICGAHQQREPRSHIEGHPATQQPGL